MQRLCSGDRMVFFTNDSGAIRYSHAKENITNHTQNSNPFLVHIQQPKWVPKPNVTIKTTKTLGENMKINICAFELGNFLNIWYQKSSW